MVHMVKVGKCALMHKKWTDRVELTKKTIHCKSRVFLRKRRLKRQNFGTEIGDNNSVRLSSIHKNGHCSLNPKVRTKIFCSEKA